MKTKIKITAKSRKFTKQAKILERIINSPQTRAEIDKRLDEEMVKWLLSPRYRGIGFFKKVQK